MTAWLLAGAVIALRAGATEPIEWQALPPLPDALGFAGPFAGICSLAGGSENEGVLVVAGGANFPDGPHWDGGTKAWHSRVFVLPTADGKWVDAGALVSGVELLPASTTGSPPGPARRFLADAYEFDPATDSWRAFKPPPVPMPAAPSPAIPLGGGDGPRLLFLSGNDWGLFSRERELRDRHPGFSRQPRIYDPATDAWEETVPLPAPLLPVVTTTTVRWGAFTVVPSGEIRPCVRSPQVFGVRSPPR